VFGASIPAPIWRDFMTVVMEDLPETRFPDEPDNIGKYLIPPPTKVPVVVGLEEKDAGELLRIEARLNVTVVEVASLEPVGIVVDQSHEPGSTVKQGTFITIYVSTGEIPVAPLPSLIGMTTEEALETVREFELSTGVKLSLFQEKIDVTDPNQVGKIVSSNPAPGTEITESASVVLFVGRLAPPSGG
ncbi:MAG: PASTA domain-containing protein, partial [Acidimicrobiia bacterium]